MTRESVYLDHALACIYFLQSLLPKGKRLLLSDRLHRDAILRNLHLLAESCGRLSEESKRSHPEIDWRGISGFRNVVVHDYLQISHERIWQVLQDDLNPLKRALEELKQNNESDD